MFSKPSFMSHWCKIDSNSQASDLSVKKIFQWIQLPIFAMFRYTTSFEQETF